MKDINKLLYSQPGANFKVHLDNKSNKHIFFSGRFGSGKTTFLRTFFDEHKEYGYPEKQFQCFHLFPVNYSVSSNEDIFELIKYDIIVEFLRNEIPIHDDNIDTSFFFIKDHYLKFLSTLLIMIPKVGKDLDDILEKFLELKKTFDEHKDLTNAKVNEGDTFANVIDALELKSGSIVESSLVTKMIEKVLARHKENNKVENILVIDDLDRIDPEHIFRILNVFSAHMDQRSIQKSPTSIKFGFDRVVLVGDIQNIRRIFRSKYGQNVDFSGYIDKFYSTRVFNFYTHQGISTMLRVKLNQTTISIKEAGAERRLSDYLNVDEINAAISFLSVLVEMNILPLRRIVQTIPNIILSSEDINFKGNQLSVENFRYLLLFDLITYYAGGCDDLEGMLQTLYAVTWTFDSMQEFASILLCLSDYEQHKMILTQQRYVVPFDDKTIVIHIKDEGHGLKFSVDYTKEGTNERKAYIFTKMQFLQLFSNHLKFVSLNSFLN